MSTDPRSEQPPQKHGHSARRAAVPTPGPEPAQPPDTTPPTAPTFDPAALGLGAFALTTFVLSVVNAGLIPAVDEPVVLGLALFYGGIVQFGAGLWEFANHNTFGATAFCSYGAFWLSFWFLVQFQAPNLPAAAAGKGIGLYLLSWAVFTAYMTVAAWRTNLAVFGVFVFLTLTYVALTIGSFAGADTITVVGGWLGIVTALIAWYASFAAVTNATFKRTVIPVKPLG